MTSEDPTSTPAPEPLPTGIQARAERLVGLDPAAHMGGRVQHFEQLGRHQLEVLIHEGLNPDSRLLDVGCGGLRAGVWLMQFLNSGCYYGIEPYKERLEAGLAFIVTPELLARAKPRFSHNDDFDLTVFDTKFDFIVARSIWTHTTKAQIGTMLDSFNQAAAPGGVLLASVVPASRLPESVRAPAFRFLHAIPKFATTRRRIVGRRLLPRDYNGDEWQPPLIAHRLDWIDRACRARGLSMSEPKEPVVNAQVWLRIERV